MKTQKSMRGVTLIEIAIVLVIIGLLLGGVLKGQELINNARVRAIADQQKSMQVAWNAFQERYQAIPGDFPRAQRYIKRTANGLGNGIIDPPSNTTATEAFLALNHLTEAGFLRCAECGFGQDGLNVPTAGQNSNDIGVIQFTATRGLRNTYGGIMGIFHDTNWTQRNTQAGSQARTRQVTSQTGPTVPSNILSEVDLKIDDGVANAGSFRYSAWNPEVGNLNGQTASNTIISECTNQADGSTVNSTDVGAVTIWRAASREPSTFENCSGALLIQ